MSLRVLPTTEIDLVEGVKADYVAGEIDLPTLEERIEALLRGEFPVWLADGLPIFTHPELERLER